MSPCVCGVCVDGDGCGYFPCVIRPEAVFSPYRRQNGLPVVKELAVWPVTYRAGDTVTILSPDGDMMEIVKDASAADSSTLQDVLNAGGFWRLENSSGEKAVVIVPWGMFNDALKVSDSLQMVKLDTEGSGPNRKGKARELPPVAYSGDGWMKDVAASATLKFISPSGAEEQIVELGTGVVEHNFSEIGTWTVRLTMKDGSEIVSKINIRMEGTYIILR
ncbi:MAG: hypothetical protein IKK82_15600 [Kiritimatiellae bacterium]|nr:hypothetical protein [Kiritimatiellia bacterium]